MSTTEVQQGEALFTGHVRSAIIWQRVQLTADAIFYSVLLSYFFSSSSLMGLINSPVMNAIFGGLNWWPIAVMGGVVVAQISGYLACRPLYKKPEVKAWRKVSARSADKGIGC